MVDLSLPGTMFWPLKGINESQVSLGIGVLGMPGATVCVVASFIHESKTFAGLLVGMLKDTDSIRIHTIMQCVV